MYIRLHKHLLDQCLCSNYTPTTVRLHHMTMYCFTEEKWAPAWTLLLHMVTEEWRPEDSGARERTNEGIQTSLITVKKLMMVLNTHGTPYQSVSRLQSQTPQTQQTFCNEILSPHDVEFVMRYTHPTGYTPPKCISSQCCTNTLTHPIRSGPLLPSHTCMRSKRCDSSTTPR